VARANGVTTAAVTPGGGILGGQVAVMNLGGWTWEEAAVEPVAGISLQFPTIGRASGYVVSQDPDRDRDFEDLKKERDAKLDALSRLLDDARAYGRAAASTRTVDWVLEALLPVVDRRVPLIVRADREREIRDAIAFAERTDVRIVISGGIEAPLVAPLLKERGIPVILGPVLTLPTREDMSHAASYQAAGELVQAGIRIAFATGDSTNVRLLPYHAAQSVAWGLSRDAALRALTIDAADILGVSDRLGSIEPGKIANLFIAKGDPLEIRTSITHVIVAGQDVGTANEHEELFQRFMARP
jgi:imidazolonepropionase-like amidohydrolase